MGETKINTPTKEVKPINNYQATQDFIRREKLTFTEDCLLRDLNLEMGPTNNNNTVNNKNGNNKTNVNNKNDDKNKSKFFSFRRKIKSPLPNSENGTNGNNGSTNNLISNSPKDYHNDPPKNIRKWFRDNYKHGKTYNFTNLFPKPIIFIIFRYLKAKDLTCLSMTCKLWYKRINQWKYATAKNDVIYEIFSSEREYLQGLNILINEYKSAMVKKPMISDEGCQTIFSNVDQIYAINKELLFTIEKRLSVWSTLSTIGDIFIELGPYLKMYSFYAANYENSNHYYTKLLEKKSNVKFMESIRLKKEVKNLDLPSYLILPIQRIPRYSLLLSQLMKVTSKSEEDYSLIEKAKELIENVATNLDLTVKGHNDAGVIQKVFSDIVSFPGEIFKDPQRKLLKEGVLVRMDKKITSSTWLILTTDCLLYANKTLYGWKFKGNLPLASLLIKEMPPTQKHPFSFAISSETKEYALSASSQEERDAWCNTIKDAMKQHIKTTEENKNSPMSNSSNNILSSGGNGILIGNENSKKSGSLIVPPKINSIVGGSSSSLIVTESGTLNKNNTGVNKAPPEKSPPMSPRLTLRSPPPSSHTGPLQRTPPTSPRTSKHNSNPNVLSKSSNKEMLVSKDSKESGSGSGKNSPNGNKGGTSPNVLRTSSNNLFKKEVDANDKGERSELSEREKEKLERKERKEKERKERKEKKKEKKERKRKERNQQDHPFFL
eukprot:TRINITY_DN7869_c0_g1_i1.p1 TRINITY_DN7869_c0_g1~~TRINITY_DN7869_c0_g1_i1.p1  ORF type:complete len:795 (-),score=251.90 TRINITY_DN7869_c0_g1_i1:677-2830(-)